MAFWSNDFMAKMRKDWMNHIAKVQYYAGGKWYDTAITGKTVSGNTICITTQTMDNLALTITKIAAAVVHIANVVRWLNTSAARLLRRRGF